MSYFNSPGIQEETYAVSKIQKKPVAVPGKKKRTCGTQSANLDLCRQRKVKCDGELPCSSCKNYKKLIQKKDCCYSRSALEDGGSKVKQALEQGTLNPESLDTPNSPYGAGLYDYNRNRNAFIDNSEIMNHLTSLSFLYDCGYSVMSNYQLAIPIQRQTPISKNLASAMGFNSLFYSTLYDLFPDGAAPFHERQRLAESFMIDIRNIKALPEYDSNQELCDDFRALLLQAAGHYNLGNPEQARELLDKTYRLGKLYGVFSIEELNFSSRIQLHRDSPMKGSVQELELIERICIWQYYLKLDTEFAMVTGYKFIIEDQLPDILLPSHSDIQKRNISPSFDLGRNTYWSSCSWSPAFDSCKEACMLVLKDYDNPGFQAQNDLKLYNYFRQIIKFSRRKLYENPQSNDPMIRKDFHNYVLTTMLHFPTDYILIGSLSDFAYGIPEKKPYAGAMKSRSGYEFYTTILSMFCYIHLSGAQLNESTYFALENNGAEMYSSKDILFATLRALAYLLDSVKVHTTAESQYAAAKYPSDVFQQCINSHPNPTLQSPYLVNLQVAFNIYYISASTLITFQSTYSKESELRRVVDVVKASIIPHLQNIGMIWPTSNQYSTELVRLVSSIKQNSLFA
ncbi:hypothetical protein HDV06_006230 [Boothiomyces sp. JEL0866]|nr:hypothetical protein HDV06_006230 [Boothiomyces sp. JEL0866]